MPTLPESSCRRPSIEYGRRSASNIFAAAAAAPCVDVLEHERELVPAEPRHEIVQAYSVAQPRGRLAQHDVAGGVAHGVVHGLEVVQVHEHHRHLGSGTVGAGARLGDPAA